jgi:hypothetical protein
VPAFTLGDQPVQAVSQLQVALHETRVSVRVFICRLFDRYSPEGLV